MNDDRWPAADTLEDALARVPAEVPPPDLAWTRIEAALIASTAETSALLRRVPAAVEPPRDLWPAIGARLAQAPSRGGPWHAWRSAAAAVGCLTVVAMVGLAALHLTGLADQLPADTDPATASAAHNGWLAQVDGLSRIETSPAGALLRAPLEAIRLDYQMTQQHRLTIEGQMQDDLDNTNLRALWRHAYEAELALTSEAERILGNLR